MSVKQPRTRKFMAHEPGFTIIDAMNRLFSGVVRRRELLGCVAGFLPRRGGRPSYAQAFGGIGGDGEGPMSSMMVSCMLARAAKALETVSSTRWRRMMAPRSSTENQATDRPWLTP